MNNLLPILFLLLSSYCFGQKDSIEFQKEQAVRDSIKFEINVINQYENLSWEIYKTKTGSYIVYYRNDTLTRITSNRRLRANDTNPIQGESVLELYFSSGQLAFGIVRCETPLENTAITRPYSLETQYYLFKNNKVDSVYKEIIGLECRCSYSNKIGLREIRKLVKKTNR